MIDIDKLIDRLYEELDRLYEQLENHLFQNDNDENYEYLLGVQVGIRKALEIISEMENEAIRKQVDLIVEEMKKGSE